MLTKAGLEYQPTQSDIDALQLALASDVQIFECEGGRWGWSWFVNGVSRRGLRTKWHAAQDAVRGMVTY